MDKAPVHYVCSVMSGLAAVCSGHLLTGHSNEIAAHFSVFGGISEWQTVLGILWTCLWSILEHNIHFMILLFL